MKKNNEELKSIDIEAGLKKEKRKKNHFLEILRFIVTGVICTLIDAGLFYVLMRFVFNGLAEKGATDGYSGYVAWELPPRYLSLPLALLISLFLAYGSIKTLIRVLILRALNLSGHMLDYPL